MYKLHSFSQSGNCYKVALLLQALRQPWEAVHMPFADFGAGVQRSDGWRQEQNAMGELPILETGGKKLTQSGAILIHLAGKHGAYGGQDEDERQEVLRWILFDNHKFTSYFATLRFLKSFSPVAPDPVVDKWLRGRVDAAYGIVERHLTTRDYMVGNQPTIADLSLAGYVYFPVEESGVDIANQYPALSKWRDRLKQLPGWKPPYALLPGEQVAPRW
jgi:glutathione S-transferase